MTAAALAALSDINPLSIAENTEFAGSIYQNADGTYSYTPPAPGNEAGSGPVLPAGGQDIAAWYHTHAAYDPLLGQGNYVYSPQDRYLSDQTQKSNYMADPRNNAHKYIPDPMKRGKGKVVNYGKLKCPTSK